jgi:hypothetical protein
MKLLHLAFWSALALVAVMQNPAEAVDGFAPAAVNEYAGPGTDYPRRGARRAVERTIRVNPMIRLRGICIELELFIGGSAEGGAGRLGSSSRTRSRSA